MPNWLKGLLGGIVAAIAQFNPVVWALFILIGLDIISGFLRAFITKSVSSDVSLRGMAKKSFILILVGLAGVIQRFLIAGTLPVDLIVGTAGFFCVTEIISILENASACGIAVPPVLVDVLRDKHADHNGQS